MSWLLKASHGGFSWLSVARRCPCSARRPRLSAALPHIDVSLAMCVGAPDARPALSCACDLLRDHWRVASRCEAASTVAELSARVQSCTWRGHVDKIIFGEGVPSFALHSAG